VSVSEKLHRLLTEVRKEEYSPVKLPLVVVKLVLASRPELMFMVCSQDYCSKAIWHSTRR
jgi:hypothetical protein